ncbi:hypothetical protein RSAG8_12434, partial [Rhizoctonia solani AG-8 WAC10335]
MGEVMEGAPPPPPSPYRPYPVPPVRSPRMSSNVTQSPAVVGQYYQVGKKIGEGSFGVVFEGTNMLNNQTVAIKFEPRKSDAPQLRDEWRSYRMLAGSRA